MGKQAARMGDMAKNCNDPTDLPTGTVIAVGTVMINKMPAAKQGDQVVGVDTHIIMIPTPGGPVPTPLPHPFVGMLDGALSGSVNIMGMPAATVDSTASAIPPHIPQGGPFQKPPANKATIMLGSFNVMIGNGGSGGGGGSGGQGSQVESSTAAAEIDESHWLDVKFVDKGGKPITGVAYRVKKPDGKFSSGILSEKIKLGGLTEGDCEITLMSLTKAEWSEKEARVGDTVKLSAQLSGFDSGTKAVFDIYEKDISSADDLIDSIKAKTSGGKVEAEWEYKYVEDTGDVQTEADKKAGYSAPEYYFVIKVANAMARSEILEFKDYVEFSLKDVDGKGIANAPYNLYFGNGEVRKGQLDRDGKKKEENIPPGKWSVSFSDSGPVTRGNG